MPAIERLIAEGRGRKRSASRNRDDRPSPRVGTDNHALSRYLVEKCRARFGPDRFAR